MEPKTIYLIVAFEFNENLEIIDRSIYRVYSTLEKAVEFLKFEAELWHGKFIPEEEKDMSTAHVCRRGVKYIYTISPELMF